MNCAKCNRDIANAKDVAKCVDCSLSYHVACCRVRTRSSRGAWKCDDCTQDVASNVSNKSDLEEPKVTDLLSSMKKYMEKHFENIEKKLETLQTSQDELMTKLGEVEKDNAQLKVECEKLKKINIELGNRVGGLEYEIAELQQYTRNQNIEIRGIPMTRNEDVYVVLKAVAQALGVAFNRDTISVAHRLPTPRGKSFHPSIVVQFTSRTTRATWIDAAKQKRISTTDLAASLPAGPVFVVDHLTARNKGILGQAKYQVKQGNLAFAWSRDGKIFVRKTADSPAHRVSSRDQVCDIAGVSVGGGRGDGSDNTSIDTSPEVKAS